MRVGRVIVHVWDHFVPKQSASAIELVLCCLPSHVCGGQWSIIGRVWLRGCDPLDFVMIIEL